MKRKKHKTPKSDKIELRRQRNDFSKKIQQIMAIIGDPSAFKLLDKFELSMMHYTRIRPYKIVNPDDGKQKFNKKSLSFFNTNLNHFLKQTFIELDEKTRMNLYDFLFYVETIYMYYRNVEKVKPEIAARFKSCFPRFEKDFNTIRVDAVIKTKERLQFYADYYSEITKHILRFVPENNEKTATSAFHNNYVVEIKNAETEKVKINGHVRLAYKIYLNVEQEFKPFTITPEKLGIDGVLQKFPLQVFVQEHAVKRIEERLGKLFALFSYHYIIFALTRKAIPTDDKFGFLFPVKRGSVTLGYLKGNIIGDKLVIRTFLFLTNNGTPEGEKLKKLIGLGKADKKYLGIDKLSTFILSDIKNDDKLKSLFSEAGCSDLFSVEKSVLDDPNKKETAFAEYLNHYLSIEDYAGS